MKLCKERPLILHLSFDKSTHLLRAALGIGLDRLFLIRSTIVTVTLVTVIVLWTLFAAGQWWVVIYIRRGGRRAARATVCPLQSDHSGSAVSVDIYKACRPVAPLWISLSLSLSLPPSLPNPPSLPPPPLSIPLEKRCLLE